MSGTEIVQALRETGIAHLALPFARGDFEAMVGGLGDVVGREAIALRDGAHAYVARPGRVPLHTDHPAVDLVAWWCERQDAIDGGTELLDMVPVLAAIPDELREALHTVELWCPRLEGGPPTDREPVLRHCLDRTAVFCSPWLNSVEPRQQPVLDTLRALISDAARKAVRRVRLRAGEVLVVDNRRILHGRAAIDSRSERRLWRMWVRAPAAFR